MIKTLLMILSVMLLAGCVATPSQNYSRCLELQKSLAKDMVVMEAARVQAIIELTKNNDPTVRALGMSLLQKNDIKTIMLDCPTR